MKPFAKTKIKALNEFSRTSDLSSLLFYARISQDINLPEKIWSCFRENIYMQNYCPLIKIIYV